jgi:hypothetical protein
MSIYPTQQQRMPSNVDKTQSSVEFQEILEEVTYHTYEYVNVCRRQYDLLNYRTDETDAVLGCNAASSSNPLLAFRDDVYVPSSTVRKSWMGPIRCPKTPAKDYHPTLRTTPDNAHLINIAAQA